MPEEESNDVRATTVVIVCYCPRCDYFMKTAVPLFAIGSHGCAVCSGSMEVYIARGSREVTTMHVPYRPSESEKGGSRV